MTEKALTSEYINSIIDIAQIEEHIALARDHADDRISKGLSAYTYETALELQKLKQRRETLRREYFGESKDWKVITGGKANE